MACIWGEIESIPVVCIGIREPLSPYSSEVDDLSGWWIFFVKFSMIH